jgi:hypothetical protein
VKTRINPIMLDSPNRPPRRLSVIKGRGTLLESAQAEFRTWQRANLARHYVSIRLAQTLDEDVEEDEP